MNTMIETLNTLKLFGITGCQIYCVPLLVGKYNGHPVVYPLCLNTGKESQTVMSKYCSVIGWISFRSQVQKV